MGRVSDALIAFIAARIDEDEAAARKAAPGPWLLENSDSDPYWNGHSWEFGPDASARHNVVRHWRIQGPRVTIDSATNDAYFVQDMEHIVRHDPARALREVTFKRAIMAEHHAELIEVINQDQDERSGDFCAECDLEQFPCPTVRLLAAAYSDHPGYCQEWVPRTPRQPAPPQ